MNLLLNPEKRIFVMSIIDSISVHWRTIIEEASSLLIIAPVSDVSTIITEGNSLTFLMSFLNKFIASSRCRSRVCLIPKRNCLTSTHTFGTAYHFAGSFIVLQLGFTFNTLYTVCCMEMFMYCLSSFRTWNFPALTITSFTLLSSMISS